MANMRPDGARKPMPRNRHGRGAGAVARAQRRRGAARPKVRRVGAALRCAPGAPWAVVLRAPQAAGSEHVNKRSHEYS